MNSIKNIKLKRQLGLSTAILVIAASMIGSGIFGNTGIIQAEVGSPLVVIGLWVLGGIIALCGALCYAELATALPDAGGEYVYLGKLFGPIPAFLSGWTSFIVGFSAPVAAAAILSSDYILSFAGVFEEGSLIHSFFFLLVGEKVVACFIVIFFGFVHLVGVKTGSLFQNILTGIKIVLLVFFILAAGYIIFNADSTRFIGTSTSLDRWSGEIKWSGLGVGLLFVMFAYSGWNAATYLAGEIKNPNKVLPRALIWGTLSVMVLFILINLVFYIVIPVSELSSSGAVAALASEKLFGPKVKMFFDLAFCLVLFSTISANIMLGPRVYYAMGRQGHFFRNAGKVNKELGTPVIAIIFQCGLSIAYILIGRYDQILAYMGFSLSFPPIVAVLGVIRLRRSGEYPKRYRMPFYPLSGYFWKS